MLNSLIRLCVDSPVIVFALLIAIIIAGVAFMPFATPMDSAPWRDPVPVDAIPDISENQVVIATEWTGRSPQDVEDQVTYPLSTALQGVPNVVDIRAISGFGFSRIYCVFKDGTDFYWARSRVLEKLATIGGALPDGVVPMLGPDATALGQIFWYTIDGPGKSLDELRAVQDFEVRYALQAVDGVAEAAGIGGHTREYQINLEPEKLRAHRVTAAQVAEVLRNANIDIGARTHETLDGGIEMLVRGVGFIESTDDIRAINVTTPDHAPITIGDVATVQLGPGFRRGVLADDRGERVGGVVIMRFGANPKRVIERVKVEVERLNMSLAPRGIRINAFYDRTQLIDETLDTLTEALWQELLITAVVILLFLLHLRTSLVVASTLPIAVLIAFIGMKLLGIDSNIMSLAGIAIAIGTMVDMGIIMSENAYNHLIERPGEPRADVVKGAAQEVGGAILAAVLTTITSFLPVFLLTDQEGKMFRPLAFTKTFCLLAAAIVAITVVPLLCRLFLRSARDDASAARRTRMQQWLRVIGAGAIVGLVGLVCAQPLGLGWTAVAMIITGIALWWASRETMKPVEQNPVTRLIHSGYQPTMSWILRHKLLFLALPFALTIAGFSIWLGARTMIEPVTKPLEAAGVDVNRIRIVQALDGVAPGIGKEFMPPLDEGSLLYMPSLLPAASLTETLEAMERQNAAMMKVPEVAQVMGKLGRVDSALDPAPVGMIETIITLRPRDQWRNGMTTERIVAELKKHTAQPGVTPSWLQPIETRIVMLQSGIRATMAMKAYGTDPEALERFCSEAESVVRSVDGATDVNAQRTNGKPYVEFVIDRVRLGHYNVDLMAVQRTIQSAIGGMPVTMTVEGRERYAVRVRFARQYREDLDDLARVLIPTRGGEQIPIALVADIETRLGPAAILTENGFAYSYVSFNAVDRDEVSVVDDARAAIEAAIADGRLAIPDGMTGYYFTGRYENQVRANERLVVLVPIALGMVLFFLYLNFRKLLPTVLVFAAVPVTFAGGFLFIAAWPSIEGAIYAVDQAILGGGYPTPTGEAVYLTVAVWVGFIALFGIAVDDGVVILTYLDQVFERSRPRTVTAIRAAVLEAGTRRIRPCLMTTLTTMIALLPVLWATGRGSDVMKPMAMPVFGGMIAELITLFVVPCVYCAIAEFRLRRDERRATRTEPTTTEATP